MIQFINFKVPSGYIRCEYVCKNMRKRGLFIFDLDMNDIMICNNLSYGQHPFSIFKYHLGENYFLPLPEYHLYSLHYNIVGNKMYVIINHKNNFNGKVI